MGGGADRDEFRESAGIVRATGQTRNFSTSQGRRVPAGDSTKTMAGKTGAHVEVEGRADARVGGHGTRLHTAAGGLFRRFCPEVIPPLLKTPQDKEHPQGWLGMGGLEGWTRGRLARAADAPLLMLHLVGAWGPPAGLWPWLGGSKSVSH